jgi:predicted O-methyltransferase YrrM
MSFINRIIRGIPPLDRYRFGRAYGGEYATIHGYRYINGWLTAPEAMLLYDISRGLSETAPVVVELGSWLGKSSVAISHGLKIKPNAKLYCIDPFNAAGIQDKKAVAKHDNHPRGLSVLEQFNENISKYGCADFAVPIQGYSHEIAKSWTRPIDFLFIDAIHTLEAVTKDFEDWSPFLKVGGRIAFHDVRLEKPSLHFSGPARLVKERLIGSEEWTDPLTANTLFSLRKTKAGLNQPS